MNIKDAHQICGGLATIRACEDDESRREEYQAAREARIESALVDVRNDLDQYQLVVDYIADPAAVLGEIFDMHSQELPDFAMSCERITAIIEREWRKIAEAKVDE